MNKITVHLYCFAADVTHGPYFSDVTTVVSSNRKIVVKL